MPKFLVEVSTEDYIRYVVEAENQREAEERGYIDYKEGVLPYATINVSVIQVDDDSPLGDC